jgi:hypothetical protein
LDAKVMMRIVSTSLSFERYQMLSTQTRGKLEMYEVLANLLRRSV